MQAKQHCRTGFTFIEMTIVVLVMGILAAVAVPTYVSVHASYRAEMAARRIIADLHYASSEAQRNSQSRTVDFDVVNNRYTLVSVADPDHSAETYAVDLVDDPFYSTMLGASFGGDSTVVFDMYGRPDDFGAVTVQTGSEQRTVNLGADGTATMP